MATTHKRDWKSTRLVAEKDGYFNNLESTWRYWHCRKSRDGDFPGGLGAQTPCFQFQGPKFDPWKGTRFHMLQLRVYVSDKQEESQGWFPALRLGQPKRIIPCTGGGKKPETDSGKGEGNTESSGKTPRWWCLRKMSHWSLKLRKGVWFESHHQSSHWRKHQSLWNHPDPRVWEVSRGLGTEGWRIPITQDNESQWFHDLLSFFSLQGTEIFRQRLNTHLPRIRGNSQHRNGLSDSIGSFTSENESKTLIQSSISYNLRKLFITTTEKLKSYFFFFILNLILWPCLSKDEKTLSGT